MRKIFWYECRRLLCNKFFVGLTLVLLFYGWQVLSRVTVLGVSHTAPFSPWSFGDYLSRMLPLLWIGALFFLTFFTSGKARRAAVLTDATPVLPRNYALARCGAALVGTGILSLACLVEAAVFYGWYFGWHRWGELLLPALITLAPPLVFALRLAAGEPESLAALCLDAPSLLVHGAAFAGGSGALERELFSAVSPDFGHAGPWFFDSNGSRRDSAASVGRRTIFPGFLLSCAEESEMTSSNAG